ncbi:AMP-dependent synthetase/ligase [Allonocardiopsis opalescens]|uniref:Acyl-CoA synthetase n=1 Tax=Allonocardiopsis opalescens TaxID=1144618 RepID=A0A2T0Q4H7_9ACTN|nr:AMP-dependent synthetase/ligase [Allonocardiopsis opalescens]PRX98611.1 long-chain acyl-CoA synthetase [Allonocardiopsis opalescens]
MTRTAVLAARAEIEAEISGLTLVDWFDRAADGHGDAPALSDPVGGSWRTLSWSRYREEARRLAAGLIDAGTAPGEVVALMLPNCADHLIADFAALQAGAVPLSVYATLAPEQVAHIAADSRARVAVLDGAEELARWRPVLHQLPELRLIVLRDAAAVPADGGPDGASRVGYLSLAELRARGDALGAAGQAAVAGRAAALGPEDTATLLYTSGTTGVPKGVIETHHQVLYQVEAAQRRLRLPDGLVTLSYLSLAHIAERVVSTYLPLRLHGAVHFCPDSSRLAEHLLRARPQLMFGVPRTWEKMHARLSAALASQPDDAARAEVERAMELGRAHAEAAQYGRTVPADLAERFAKADEAVLKPIRALIGLDRAVFYGTAAAPMPDTVLRFFTGLGMVVADIYGMTENAGASTMNSPDCYRLGTVGRALDGIELRTAEDGELLVRGPVNTPGYLNQPHATAALAGADGWLRTGDLAEIDDDGFVRILDRKKELIITAGGENISPASIENLLKEHPLISQALAYGDRRPYPVALLTLDPEAAPAWARAAGVSGPELDDLGLLAAHPVVVEEVQRAVDRANRRLARVQQVKRWRLLSAEWTPETDELTPSLKLKRRVITAKYGAEISALYDA